MEEEIITWNLRGPKRMRKRKELNALVKNNARYKSSSKKTSSIDMFNMNSGASRLLKSNDSSTDNEQFYFAANKHTIKEKQRKNCCKLIQLTIFGFIVTFFLILAITLAFSYSRFHEALKDLKDEFKSQKEQNQHDIDNFKQKLRHYDALFKQNLKTATNPIVSESTNKAKRSLINNHYSNSNWTDKVDEGLLKKLLWKNSKIELNFTTYEHLVNMIMNNSNQIQSLNKFLNSSYKSMYLNEIKPIYESLKMCNCLSSKKLNNSLPIGAH